MKKVIILFIVVIAAISSAIVWIINSDQPLSLDNSSPLIFIIFIVLFAILVGWKRLKNIRRGEPVADELSKKILLKASSISFYISLYTWIIMIYISDKVNVETHTLISAGILVMTVIFILSWVFYQLKGLKDV